MKALAYDVTSPNRLRNGKEDTLDHRFYRTGEFARKAAVTVRTLRYYDKIGLLSPTQLTESGQRLYTASDLRTLQRILALKHLGFTLEQVQALLHAQPDRLKAVLIRQCQELRERRGHLERTLQVLEEAVSWLQASEWDWDRLTQTIQGKRIMSKGTTLHEALQRLEVQLVQDNKQHFLPLLEESAVREAIQVAQASYTPGEPGSKGEIYYRTVIQPLLRQIAEDGTWPDNTELDAFYEATDATGVKYPGLGLSLEIATSGMEFKGFSLPLLDVWYGRWV